MLTVLELAAERTQLATGHVASLYPVILSGNFLGKDVAVNG
jgi:hypothetical protein